MFETARNENPAPYKGVAAAHLDEEKQDVQRDQRKGDQRDGPARAVVITDWKHEIYLLLLVGGMSHRNDVGHDAGQSSPFVMIA
jgi:hypothetical protein